MTEEPKPYIPNFAIDADGLFENCPGGRLAMIAAIADRLGRTSLKTSDWPNDLSFLDDLGKLAPWLTQTELNTAAKVLIKMADKW